MLDFKRLAFVDETGNFGFNFSDIGTSQYFIVTCIITDEFEVTDLESGLEEIAKTHFSGGEIKSNQVKNAHERRMRILNDICKLNFHVVALICDKRLIYSESLVDDKKTFIKFIHGKLFKQLYASFKNLTLLKDNYGSDEFMHEFNNYVQKHIPPVDLFNESKFSFEKARNSKLVQLADFIGGTLAKTREDNVKNDFKEIFYKYLVEKSISLEEFPTKILSRQEVEYLSDNEHDRTILDYSVKAANNFIVKNINKSSQAIKDRVNCLRYLMNYLKYVDSNRFVHGAELLEYINRFRKQDLSSRQFSATVIGKLRDNGVLISNSINGYKIVATEDDLNKLLRLANSMFNPLMDRIYLCRKQILFATDRKLDILKNEEFKNIKGYFDSYYSKFK